MRLLPSILLATDFLPASDEAARVAIRLARRFGSRVTLLHALEPVPNWLVGFPYALELATQGLHQFAARLTAQGVQVAETVVKVGPAADTILRHAQVVAADLIVIGAGEIAALGAERPQTPGTGRFVLGPVAQAVLERAEPPVLAVRPDVLVRYGNILCPVDHSEVSRRALQNAVWLAHAFGGSLLVLSVVPEVGWLSAAAESGTLTDVQDAHVRRWDEELAEFLRQTDFGEVRWALEVRHGAPHREILAAARQHHSDLIVMGSTGRTGLVRVLLGSTTRRVLRDLPCSLLTVKGEGMAGEVFEEDFRAAEVLLAQGRGLLGAHSYTAAADKFRHALAHDATLAPAMEGLAEALEHLGRRNEAAAYRGRLATLAAP